MKGRHADKNKQGAPVDNDGGGGYATAAGDNDDDNGADDDEGDMILFAMKERHWCGRAQAGRAGHWWGQFLQQVAMDRQSRGIQDENLFWFSFFHLVFTHEACMIYYIGKNKSSFANILI